MNSLREARFAEVLADIKKRWGADALRPLSAEPADGGRILATGFDALDARLASGGLPLGQLAELHGDFASGVTTLALSILANGQASGVAHPAAYIDLAHAFDADYAARCGVNLQRLLVVRPERLDEAFDIAGELVTRYGARLLVLDQSFETPATSRQAVASAAFRRLTALIRGSACALLALTRPQPGQAQSPLVPYAALCLHLRLVRWTRRHGEVNGSETQITVIKQKQGGGGQLRLRLSFEPAPRGVL